LFGKVGVESRIFYLRLRNPGCELARSFWPKNALAKTGFYRQFLCLSTR